MNRVTYFEIHVDDPKRAARFYSDALGWKITKYEGLGVDYWTINTGEEGEPGINGGMIGRSANDPDPRNAAQFTMSAQLRQMQFRQHCEAHYGGQRNRCPAKDGPPRSVLAGLFQWIPKAMSSVSLNRIRMQSSAIQE